MVERGIVKGDPSAQRAAEQTSRSVDSSPTTLTVAPTAADSPLANAVVSRAGVLQSINQFLDDMAGMPADRNEAKELTQELVTSAANKFLLLNDGRYWERDVSDEAKAAITKYYPTLESFYSNQKHLAFPNQILPNGEPFALSDITPLHPFSLAVVRHIASPSVTAVDVTPGVGAKIESGSDGIYSVISFGARLGMFSKIENFFFPNARSFTLMHEGAHHLFCSLAAGKDGGPSWLKHFLVEPPPRTWGLGQIMRSNHATLYGEVLANYVACGGDAEAAVRETKRSYPGQWTKQFVGRFPCAKSLSAEGVIIGLQQLTERYPAATWLDLQNIDEREGEVSALLS